MRLLYVTSRLTDSGGTRLMVGLGRALQQLGVAVEIFSLRPDASPSLLAEADGLPVTLGSDHVGRLRRAAPTITRRLLVAAARNSLVVSIYEWGEGLMVAYAAARLTRRPVAALVQANIGASLHHGLPRDVPVTRFIYPRLDAAICVSEGLLPTLRELHVPAERAFAVRNGIDVERVRALARQLPAIDVPKGPFVVGMGRLGRVKGFDILIRAHARARAVRPHRLVILGEGPERPVLERLAADLDVADSVVLPGFVANPFPVLVRAIAFCLSSRYEGAPLVCLEALALGVPVIATDCVAGPDDLLEHGRYGALVGVESVEALVASLAAHLTDPGDLTARARLGQDRRAEFDIAACARGHLAVYERILSRSRQPAPFSRRPPTTGRRETAPTAGER